MNKTLTINLAGLVFNIEEDAYDILKSYLAQIKNHFKNEEGCDEIVADIEARLAELLKAKIHGGKQVLVTADVQEAIAVMGKPEDFAGEETGAHSESNQYKYTYSRRTRRIFRDTDNKVLGGVCSGIGSYFDMDPLWIRLALVIMFFGFGTGFLLYIILWIIIPPAKTTAEKLEMRGEPIDVNTISKTIKEEAHQFKNRMKDFGDEIKGEYEYHKKAGNVHRVGSFISLIFYNILQFLAKIVGVFFVLIGLCFFVGVLCILFNVGTIFGLSVHNFFDAFAGHDFSLFYIKTGIALCVGIPFSMLVYKGMKLILGIRGSYRWLNISAGTLWFAGLVMCLYVFMNIANGFSEETELKQQIPLQNQPSDTLFIKANNNKPGSDIAVDFGWDRNRWLINITKQPNEWWGKTRLNIITSENDSMYAFVIRSAQGNDKPNAAGRAKNIMYKIESVNNTLVLDRYFNFNGTDKFRNQEVEILLKLPKNKKVYLDNSLKNILYDVENTNSIIDSEMGNKYWQMTENGLSCLSCTDAEIHGNVSDEEIGIHIQDSTTKVKIDVHGIEVHDKDADVKISAEGIHIHEKKKEKKD